MILCSPPPASVSLPSSAGGFITVSLILLNTDSEVLGWIKNNHYTSVVFLSGHKNIKIQFTSKINAIQNYYKKNGKDFYFGFITARDEWSMLWLIMKNIVYIDNEIERYITVDRLDHNAKVIYGNEYLKIIPYNMSDLNTIKEEVMDNCADLLSAIGHGRDDIFWLKDGAICGKCNNKNIGSFYGKKNVPSCFYTNKCFKSKDTGLVYANQIAARNIFANACYSSKVEEGLFADDFNIVFSYIDGHAASYLGSSFMIAGQRVMNYYYIAQMLSGINIGNVAYNVSSFYLNYHLGHELAFFLIGDPNYSIKKCLQPYRDVLVENKNNNEYIIENQTNLVTITFPNLDTAKQIIEINKRINISFSNNKNFYFAFRMDNEKAYLDIFGKIQLKPGVLAISTEDFPYINLKTIKNFEAILGVGIYPTSKFKSLLIETKELANKIAKEKKYRLCNVKDINVLYKRMENYNEKIITLSKIVLQYVIEHTHNNGFSLNDLYLENGLNFLSSYSEKKEKCPNCGRDLYVLKYNHDLYSCLDSELYNCSACGIVKFIPSDKKEILICTSGEKCIVQGESVNQTVCIQNNTEVYLCGYVGMSVTSGKDDFFTYDKGINLEKIDLYPGEKMEYSLSISTTKETTPHNYWIYTNVIINGQIWNIKNDLWVALDQV